MFSPRIQNLIDTGGKEAAIQRAVALNERIETINNQLTTQISKTEAKQKFTEALKTSLEEKNVFRLKDTTLDIPPIQKFKDTVNITKEQIGQIVSKISKKYNIDEKLVNAVIKQESGYNIKAKSKAGAMGLMQLMPATAKSLGVKDAYNPVQNIEGGVKYLSGLLKRYNGNIVLALAAYNAGSGAVSKYSGVPPYKETQNYVKSILANYLG